MQGEAEHALRCRPPFKSNLEDLIEEVLLGSLPSSTLSGTSSRSLRRALSNLIAATLSPDTITSTKPPEGMSLDMAARISNS
jgi:hypothetical protein